MYYTIPQYILNILYYVIFVLYTLNINTILYYTILYYTILYYTFLYYNILWLRFSTLNAESMAILQLK